MNHLWNKEHEEALSAINRAIDTDRECPTAYFNKASMVNDYLKDDEHNDFKHLGEVLKQNISEGCRPSVKGIFLGALADLINLQNIMKID